MKNNLDIPIRSTIIPLMKIGMKHPHSGGVNIPKEIQQRTQKRIEKYAAKYYAGRYTKLGIRFKGALCYIDTYQAPREPAPSLLKLRNETRDKYIKRLSETPTHLCRLRYFGEENAWSLAFYTYRTRSTSPVFLQTEVFTGHRKKDLMWERRICKKNKK